MIIKLDFESDIPIYQQLRHQIVMGIGSGELLLGEDMPTVRQLAKDAGVNPMTVNKAYQLLKQEGFLVIDRRHGAKVNTEIPELETYAMHLERHLDRYVTEARLRGISEAQLLAMLKNLYRKNL